MRPTSMSLLILFGACGVVPKIAATPAGEPAWMSIYPHDVLYQLLAIATGRACAEGDDYKRIARTKSPDPRAIGAGYLFERAKYEAIANANEADGLVGVRAVVERKADAECVTVTGRAYRIAAMHATAPGIVQVKPEITAAPVKPPPVMRETPEVREPF